MVKFLDGPAAGVILPLRRAPKMLRAVRGPKGWDALDQPDDRAQSGEHLYVYVAIGTPTYMHLCCRPRANGGMFACAQFRRWWGEQPDDAVMRDNAQWAQWCEVNRAAITADADGAARMELADELKTARDARAALSELDHAPLFSQTNTEET